MPTIGLEPIIDGNSRILILGTLPGDKSLRTKQYYADSSNNFWKILSAIYNEEFDSNYNSRRCFLFSKGIALWDVLKAAERAGSLDSAIKEEIPNDFLKLFVKYPKIEAIGLNGSEAKRLFRKHCTSSICSEITEKRIKYLPSTSGTPGQYVKPVIQRVRDWGKFLKPDAESIAALRYHK